MRGAIMMTTLRAVLLVGLSATCAGVAAQPAGSELPVVVEDPGEPVPVDVVLDAQPKAPVVVDAKSLRLGDALAELLPIGHIFEMSAKEDPNFPLGDKAGNVSAEELACLRSELSVEGYRRIKHGEAATYVRDHGARIDDDLKVLESGATRLMSRLVIGGAAASGQAVNEGAQEILKQAKPEELLSFMTFASDPNYAELRKLSGLGETINPLDKSQSEVGNGGEALGASLGMQFILRAMGTCDVPASKFL